MVGAICTGVVSGLISSALLYFAMFRIKPKVVISENICRDCAEKNFAIKIVNHSRVNLVDMKYALHHCRRYSDGRGTLTEIAPCKSRLEFIDPYSKLDEHSDYAVQITYGIDDNVNLGSNDSLIFNFYAKHALSGTSTFMTKEYRASNIQCGRFETGTSTKILVETSCDKTFSECKGAAQTNYCSIT